ncbi:MAG: DUF5335 family protein [Myxococcales bacterium]|jgi:hypothetical protein
MTTRKLEPGEWQGYFDGVSKRIPSVRVGVSILGDKVGVQSEAQGSPLVGISWDHNDRVLTVDTTHWSHRMEGPSEIFVREEGGTLSSIEVVHTDGTKQIVELEPLPALPAS